MREGQSGRKALRKAFFFFFFFFGTAHVIASACQPPTHLVRRDEAERRAAAARTGYTADAVHKELGLGGKIVVDDIVQHGNVNTTRGHVRHEQQVDLTRAEASDVDLSRYMERSGEKKRGKRLRRKAKGARRLWSTQGRSALPTGLIEAAVGEGARHAHQRQEVFQVVDVVLCCAKHDRGTVRLDKVLGRGGAGGACEMQPLEAAGRPRRAPPPAETAVLVRVPSYLENVEQHANLVLATNSHKLRPSHKADGTSRIER